MTGDADNSNIGKPLAQLNDFHRGGESGLVTGADFKSVGPGRERRSVGFDSHTPPPILF